MNLRLWLALRRWLSAAGLLLASFATAIEPPKGGTPNGTNIRTAHFLLYSEVLDADETGRFLEAAYAEMKKFFNDLEPDRKLQVKIFESKERYQREIDRLRRVFAIKRRIRDISGVYLRETACSYLHVQRQEYITRQVLLHEVAHQYHDYLRPWSRAPSLDFCEEGIAEYFALHNWDGKVLRLGIAPQIGSLDYTRAALQQLRNSVRFDLERIVAGETEMDYPLAWGLVSFLIDRHRAKFDIWRQGINNDVEPRVVWQKQFGPITTEFVQALESWLQSNSPPWQVVSGEWLPWGESIQGRAEEDEFALALLSQTPRNLTVTLDSSLSNAVAGVAFGFRGARNFYVLQQGMGKDWELGHYVGAYFPKEERRIFSAASGTPKISIEPGERSTTLKFGDHTTALTNVLGHVGVWVKEGKSRFACQWE